MDGFPEARMSHHTIALFGEAEKGSFRQPHVFSKMTQLVDFLGSPPPESQGIFFAVQAILYKRCLIFFRVKDEGFSAPDYFHGLNYLQEQNQTQKIAALCLPGVGDPKILEVSQIVCELHKSFLITTQKDLYDYLTTAL